MSPRQPRYADRRGRIKKTLSQLDELILLADSNKQDVVLTGYLTNFLVLRLSGALEYCVSEALKIHLDRCGNPEVTRFVELSTERLMNLDSNKLENLFSKFSDQWAATVKAYLDMDENRQLLNSLIGTRNVLAHGGSSTVRLGEVYRYKTLIEELLTAIVNCLDPRRP
jgi:RiboL-PSP-HEPN